MKPPIVLFLFVATLAALPTGCGTAGDPNARQPVAGRVAVAGDRNARPSARLERYEFAQVHMGMPVRIVLYAASDSTARAAATAAFDTIARLDHAMSDYRDDGELRRLEARPPLEWTPLSDPLFLVLARAIDFARASDGAFDPTIGPLTSLWREARRIGAPPDPAAIDSARARVGWPAVDIDSARRAIRFHRPGIRFDLGGIAKGFILDAALRSLRAHQAPRALLEAGGDIVAGDPPPGLLGWRIDVLGADSAFQATAGRLANAALASSGASRQFLDAGRTRYSHVIDPASGLGLTDSVTVHVIAADGATADALATTLGLLPRQRWPALVDRHRARVSVAPRHRSP